MVITGAVELAVWKSKCRGVFVEVLRDRWRFLEVDNSIVYKVEIIF